MEYEISALIEDLELPRDVIQEDVAKGRLVLDQHLGDPNYYVDHDIFVDYLTERVIELGRDEKRAFWSAVKKIITRPDAERRMTDGEMRAVLQAIDRELAKCV